MKMQTTQKTRKRGRPAWVPSQEDIEKAQSLAAQGMTKEHIADCLGICYDTLNVKSQDYPAFSSALKKGRALGIAKVTEALLNNIELGNVTAQIYYLKCQAGWKEPKDEVSNDTKSLVERIIDKL